LEKYAKCAQFSSYHHRKQKRFLCVKTFHKQQITVKLKEEKNMLQNVKVKETIVGIDYSEV